MVVSAMRVSVLFVLLCGLMLTLPPGTDGLFGGFRVRIPRISRVPEVSVPKVSVPKVQHDPISIPRFKDGNIIWDTINTKEQTKINADGDMEEEDSHKTKKDRHGGHNPHIPHGSHGGESSPGNFHHKRAPSACWATALSVSFLLSQRD